ncbi:Eco57I restriction-modification methylase domain-containing protein [Halogeometricum limi]|uniref:site-specific DNA-methyltransferase (adenine-specific) n=1 Tax=Halogeometricum limi TaxID=555875 RepID=A0A1I6IK43_9EURY|nr:TaqI-like C-terminal specificity domain-containing protein [Halogeometricum limi]SFR66680.1 Methyltransferase domain-containing protein [Halogeometricum limi]
MTHPRRAAVPLFAPTTLAVDGAALAADGRDDRRLAERARSVARAWRSTAGDETPRERISDALGLAAPSSGDGRGDALGVDCDDGDGDDDCGGTATTAPVAVESVSAGGLDAAGREPAARRLVRRLDETTRWGVLTDGRYWRLYGGDDPDEERFAEFDLRAVFVGGDGDADSASPSLHAFVSLFAREAFAGDDSFLDGLFDADTERRRTTRNSLCDRFVAAVETLSETTGATPETASALCFCLLFDLYALDRAGVSRFAGRSDHLRRARRRLAASGGTTPATTDELDSATRDCLSAWVASAADSTLGGPSAGRSDADPSESVADSTSGVRALDAGALDADTVRRVCTLLAAVPVGDDVRVVDFRTVETRLFADAHERLVDAPFADPSSGSTTRRKADGSFYTPAPVVRYLAARAVDSAVGDAETATAEDGTASMGAVRERLFDVRVLDPAMGGGTLLVAVADRLVSHLRRLARERDAPVESYASLRRTVVSRCLYGVDGNHSAVAVARLACHAETLGPDSPPRDRPRWFDHLRWGDTLLGPGPDAESESRSNDAARPPEQSLDSPHRRPPPIRWNSGFSGAFGAENSGQGGVRFDAVVGNPPWKGTAGRAGVSARLAADVSTYLRETFESTKGAQPNLYAAFLERACRLAPSGYVAFVVPDAILVRLSAAPARRFLLERGVLTHVLRVGHVFPDANEGAAIVVCGPVEVVGTEVDASGAAETAIRTWYGDADEFADAVAAGSLTYGRLRRDVVETEPYARLQLLRDDIADGVFRKLERFDPLESVGTVARGEEFGKRDERVVSGADPCGETRRLVPGSAVRPYALRSREVRRVATDAVTKDVYDPPKLCCRQTGRFLVATLDTDGVANLKSVYDVHARDGDERTLSHLLGLVNSTVYNYYHYVRRNAYPAQFPQNNQRNYETLPVWNGSADDELVELVDRRRTLARELASLDTEIAAAVPPEAASVPLSRFDPVRLDDSLSRSHRRATPGLRIADLSVRVEDGAVVLRVTYVGGDGGDDADRRGDGAGDDGRAWTAARDVFRFEAPTPDERAVLTTWLPAVGAATAAVRRASGLRPVGRSSRTTPEKRLAALCVPDPTEYARRVARYARDCRDAAALSASASALDDRIDDRVASLVGLTDAERAHVRATMTAVPGWTSLRDASP